MFSSIPSFVHPASEAFATLSSSHALTYDPSHDFTHVAATDTTVGSDGTTDYKDMTWGKQPGGGLKEADDVRIAHIKKVDSTTSVGLYAEDFVKYFSYEGSLAVAGKAFFQTGGGTQKIAYSLTGLDPDCLGHAPGPKANSCGIHIHTGTDCTSNAGGHWYYTSSDPWTSVTYRSGSGSFSVTTGLTEKEITGHAFIVHGFDGGRIGCATIKDKGVVVASFQSGGLEYESVYVDQAHMYGYSTCKSYGRCHATQEVGAACHKQDDPDMKGYCYTSSAGHLECGRVIKASHRFGGVPVDTAPYSPMVSCPRGSPGTSDNPTGIEVQAKRFLYAGCMIDSDPAYEPAAEVHVPNMCLTPATYKPGCMFPGASNFVHGSKQPTFCQYKTAGCTSKTALNYNDKATPEDDDGSCIEPLPGCTLKDTGYWEVDAKTPGFQSLYHGSTGRNEGIHALPDHKTVTNYDPKANVLKDCKIAIEGCMDSTAVNYEPAATINSGTWCIPKIEGCMMPDRFAGSSLVATRTYSGASNFDPSATKQDVKSCKTEREGCLDPNAINYDKHATVAAKCYLAVPSCLDPKKYNYACIGEAANKPTKCATTLSPYEATGATVHVEEMCLSTDEDFTASTTAGSYEVTVTIVFAGTVDDLTEEVKGEMAKKMADKLGVDQSKIKVVVKSGSVIVTFIILTDSPEARNTLTAAIDKELITKAQADALFAGTGAPVVISTPTYTVVYVVGSANNAPIIAGAVVGGLALVCLIVIVYMKVKKKGCFASGGSYDKAVVPA